MYYTLPGYTTLYKLALRFQLARLCLVAPPPPRGDFRDTWLMLVRVGLNRRACARDIRASATLGVELAALAGDRG